MFATYQLDKIISSLSQDFHKLWHVANFGEEVQNANAQVITDFLLIVLAFSTSKNFKLACCLGGFYPQILLNLVKYALFIHIARVPCFFLKYFLVLSRTDYPLKKCSETSQYRTSQIADVLWLADKRFSPKCKNLFKITSQWRTPQ